MPLTFNGNTPENVNWNGVALSKVTYNGGVVWEKKSGYKPDANWWWATNSFTDTYTGKNTTNAPNNPTNKNYKNYLSVLKFPIKVTSPCKITVDATFISSSYLSDFSMKVMVIDPTFVDNVNSIKASDIENNYYQVTDTGIIKINAGNVGSQRTYEFAISQSKWNRYYEGTKMDLLIGFISCQSDNTRWYVGGLSTSSKPVVVNIT